MEILRFIFSSFWVWLGFIILICAISSEMTGLMKACKHQRKITGYRMDERWRIEIEDASAEDVQRAMRMGALLDAERAEGKNE